MIQGTFTVSPLAAGTPGTSLLDEWVGIDGWGNSNLTQAGVMVSTTPCVGVLSYGATGAIPTGQQYVCPWTVLIQNDQAAQGPLPTIQVSPGDSVTVLIEQNGGSSWTITMTDNTNSQTWSSPVQYSGPQNTAEWIAESPGDHSVACGTSDSAGLRAGCQLAPYTQPITFSGLQLANYQSTTNVNVITMEQNGVAVSSPSTATNIPTLLASGFTVNYTGPPPT
jgi:plastocyanin